MAKAPKEPIVEEEVDAAAAKKARKAAKRAAAEAAAAAEAVEAEPEVDVAEEKKKKKAAKKAAAAAAAAEAEAEEEVDPIEEKKKRKAAKKAAAEAAAKAEAAEEEEEDENVEDEPPAKKSKHEDSNNDEMEVDASGGKSKGKGKGKDGKGKGNKEFEVFVGGLPFSTTEDVLRKDFSECGEIVDFRMPLNEEGNARGIAFIEYTDKASCEKACAFNETEYGGRWLRVRMSGDEAPKGKGKDKGKDGKGKGKGNKEFEIFVGGLPFATTEESLKKDFEECGEIVNIRVPLNDEGSARGIGFIEYKDKESVEKALKFHETEYGGRYISVRMSGEDKGKGKGKDGKGKDGKGKGKKGKNKSGLSNENRASQHGSIVEATGTKQTFDSSDDE